MVGFGELNPGYLESCSRNLKTDEVYFCQPDPQDRKLVLPAPVLGWTPRY